MLLTVISFTSMLALAVQHQQSSLTEYSLASGAGKMKLSYIGLHVSFQVVNGDESFATHAVISPVLYMVGLRETLSTLDKSIWLAFYRLLLMDPQCTVH